MENDRIDVLAGLNVNASGDTEGKYLTFYIDGQLYGFPIADVIQIVGMQDITSVPELPYYAKGIINLRGTIIPVIETRLRMNKPETEYNERTCIIVTQIDDALIGFVVDSVDAVMYIDESKMSLPPRLKESGSDCMLDNVARSGDDIIMLLDMSKILPEGFSNIIDNM